MYKFKKNRLVADWTKAKRASNTNREFDRFPMVQISGLGLSVSKKKKKKKYRYISSLSFCLRYEHDKYCRCTHPVYE